MMKRRGHLQNKLCAANWSFSTIFRCEKPQVAKAIIGFRALSGEKILHSHIQIRFEDDL